VRNVVADPIVPVLLAITLPPNFRKQKKSALDPPLGGTFHFENLVMPPLTKTCPKMVLSDKGGSLCVKDAFAKKIFWCRERELHMPLNAIIRLTEMMIKNARGCPGKLLSPARRRACIEQVRAQLHVSERRASAALRQHRSTQRQGPAWSQERLTSARIGQDIGPGCRLLRMEPGAPVDGITRLHHGCNQSRYVRQGRVEQDEIR